MRLTFRLSFPIGGERVPPFEGAAPARVTTVAQAMSNWPSLAPAMNAFHSCGVKRSTGPSGSFGIAQEHLGGHEPTSTQAGLLAPES